MASVVYITRDIERALGMEPRGDYYIITNTTPYSKEIKKRYRDNVYLIESREILDTYDIMILPEVEDIIVKHKAKIMVFKNTLHIEELCRERGWEILNPNAKLSDLIENKITQISWLGELSLFLPPYSISIIKDINWNNKPFILQWSHGHTGEGTILIQNENDLENIKSKFLQREAKITDFIKGPVFTINIIISDKEILFGNISYQITGMMPFTENPFSTIGNDWSVPKTILSQEQIERFHTMSKLIADKMRGGGWFGLFGIDIIHDEERDNFHILEINARQTASVTYESELQNKIRNNRAYGITVFEAHYKALMHEEIDKTVIEINDGAQILQRYKKNINRINIEKIINSGYKVIEYANIKSNSDYLRIQSEKGIMETHNKFNKRGKEILDIISEKYE